MADTVEASEFIEEDFIGAMERQLEKHVYSSWMTISRISQSSERHLGYDGVLTSALPFYIQFKRSTLYRSGYSGQLYVDRKAAFGPEHSFYGFELHKNSRTGCFEQHNALYALSKSFPCAYVAPLFHRTKQLSDYKTKKPPRVLPWHYHHGLIHDGPAGFAYRSRMFDMTVAICPHKHLPSPDPSHHYTYSRKLAVCFHSEPEPFESRQQSFARFLGSVMGAVERREAEAVSFGNLIEQLGNLYPEGGRGSLARYVRLHAPAADSWELAYQLPAVVQLAIVEDALWQDFGIRQYVAHGTAV